MATTIGAGQRMKLANLAPLAAPLRTVLPAYVRCCHTIRLHSGLAYLSPLAFERRVA